MTSHFTGTTKTEDGVTESSVWRGASSDDWWVLADYGGKDLWKMWVLSLAWNGKGAMDGESGKKMEDELEIVTSAGEWLIGYKADEVSLRL